MKEQTANLPAVQTDSATEISANKTLAIAQFQPTEIVVVDKKKLQSAEVKSINMSLDYHEFAQGEEVRGIYLGLTHYRCEDKQTREEKVLTAAVFIDAEGNPKVNAAAKFVDAVSRFELKQAFSATHTRIKKTGNGGNMQLFDIRKLDYLT